MNVTALLNPLRWFQSPGPARSPGLPGAASADTRRISRTNGVPMGSVKALPGQLASRFFSSENRRKGGRGFVQGELPLPEAQPVRSDLFEDDVELVRRRKETRLIHETRTDASTPGVHNAELAVNRLRPRPSREDRVAHRE